MALDDRHLDDILLGIYGLGITLVFREDLSGDHADTALGAGNGKIFRLQNRQMEGVRGQFFQIIGDLRLREGEHLPLVKDQTALFVNGLDLEIGQIIHNGKVSQISGGNGAPVVQQEVPGRVQTCHLHHLNGVSAQSHCLAADVIHVSFFQQIIGMLVIGAEHTAVEMPG